MRVDRPSSKNNARASTTHAHNTHSTHNTAHTARTLRMRSPNFSSLIAAWNGSCSSEPVMTMFGKSSRCTSSGSSMPLRVTMMRLGCSSTGRLRTSAATSSDVFHLASGERRFGPAQSVVWMICEGAWWWW